MIYVENKKKSSKTLSKLYPFAKVIDVTSKGNFPFVKLSPFYPHGNIPVPFSQNNFAKSVEEIWQGLKVFELEDVDTSKFEIEDMKGIKRTTRKFGKPLGHRKGINGPELLDYLTARKLIYLPSYAWILQNATSKEIELLVEIAKRTDLILLDYETNCDIENLRKPLSHAGLVKKYIDKKYPEVSSLIFFKSITQPVSTAKKTEITRHNVTKKKPNPRTMLKKDDVDKLDYRQLTLDL
ncbi:MAG: hypothetical protein RBQ97_11795 [Acholeplasma sp.]|nr:hypothetical protein [Acholeplasma sp.]